MLSDKTIKKLIIEKGLVENYQDLDVQLQPCGLDLTLDYVERNDEQVGLNPTIIDFDNSQRRICDTIRVPVTKEDIYEIDGLSFSSPIIREWYILRPGTYVFHTKEQIRCPQNISGFMLLRSSLCRGGATCTSALVDPGYYGHLTLSVNIVYPGLNITRGGRFAQIIFFHLDADAVGEYNGIYKEIPGILIPHIAGNTPKDDLEEHLNNIEPARHLITGNIIEE